MTFFKSFPSLIFLSTIIINGVSSGKLFAPRTMFERLELNPKYFISWTVAEGTDEITFELSAETLGFIGFGLSPNGGMQGADMIIGGVFENGTSYFSDRHGVKGDAVVDESQDWKLLKSAQNATHTVLTVSRLLNTCDDQDIPITMDTAKLIWSFGESDEVVYHGRDNRGTKSTNLLFPPKVVDTSGYKIWNMNATTPVPRQDTTYWCTFHKSPIPPPGFHIVAWDVLELTEIAAKYTHHVDVKRCIAPTGSNATDIFDKYVDTEGFSCYDTPGDYPIHHCESYVLTWAVGRGLTVMPDDIGYAVAEDDSTMYFVLEVHYDNPTLDNVPLFTTGLQIYYTETHRPIDADLLGVGHLTLFTLTVPPKTEEFVISGHCSAECTQYFPEEGLTVFSGLLHSHLSGRKLKLRHFRDGKELPWISFDNNFDFNFQENKKIDDIKILRGDSFTYECTYSTTWKNGSAVVSGLGSRDEMCVSWLWYYPKINLNFCYSYYPIEQNLQDFGIQNYTWVEDPFGPPPMIWAPEEMAGKSYQEVMDSVIDWTPDRIHKLQEDHRYGEHEFLCHSVKDGRLPTKSNRTKYVQFDEEYKPEELCQANTSAPSITLNKSFLTLTAIIIALTYSV